MESSRGKSSRSWSPTRDRATRTSCAITGLSGDTRERAGEKFGVTAGSLDCASMVLGMRRAARSKACRALIVAVLMTDADGTRKSLTRQSVFQWISEQQRREQDRVRFCPRQFRWKWLLSSLMQSRVCRGLTCQERGEFAMQMRARWKLLLLHQESR